MIQFFGRSKKAWRAQRGFTLMELLAVIAILGILAGIAIPSIGDMQQSLKSTELDSVAREIFLAAQNNASALRAQGALGTIESLPMSAQPGDFPTGADAPAWNGTDYCYLTESAQDIGKLLPPGGISDTVRNPLNNSYVIEYNKKTGEIYGVFYAETQGSITYGTALDALRSSKTARQAAKIGYYGGAASALPDIDRTPTPSSGFLNAEELSIAIGTNNLDLNENDVFALTLQNPAQQSEKLTFTVACENGGVWSITGGGALALEQPKADAPLRIVLDSLAENKHFKDLLPSFTPGCDLMLSLTATRKGVTAGGKTYLPSDKVSAQSNSLFAGVDASGARPLLSLAYGRHLQNLENSISGYSTPTDGVDARQTAEINWDHWNNLPTSIAFTPINITRLRSFDGQGNPIRNLSIGLNPTAFDSGMGNSKGAGLFGRIENCALSRIRIVRGNLAVTTQADGFHYLIGGLAGCANQCTVTDCAASLERIRVDGAMQGSYKRNVGGLIGYAGKTAAAKTTLRNSYANTGALYVETADNQYDRVGAFIGTLANGSAENCYALGELTLACPVSTNPKALEKTKLSGFANVDAAGNFSHCYTAATYGDDMHLSATVHAFSNIAEAGDDDRFFLRTAGITEIAKDAATGYGNGRSYTEMTEAAFATALGSAFRTAPGAPALTEPYLLTGDYPFPGLTEQATAAADIIHYGDWPEKTGDVHLVYYEKYEELNSTYTYGYYAGNRSGAYLNTLDNLNDPANSTSKVIKEDGYAILIENASGTTPPSAIACLGYGENGALIRTSFTKDATRTASLDGKSYSVYPFSGDIMADSRAQTRASGAPLTSFFHRYTCNGYTLFCNPHFAASAVNGQDYQFEDPQVMDMRTARQLFRLGQTPQDSYWDRYITQKHDIDFATYGSQSAVFECAPIGNATTDFTGVFDGNPYTIRHMNVKGGTARHVGMFGRVAGKGRLANIRLVNAVVSGGASNGAAGILVGTAEEQIARTTTPASESMILNCYVYAERYTTTGGSITPIATAYPCSLTSPAQYLGGLVGQARGCAIQGSLASPYSIESTGSGTVYAGGFAGMLSASATSYRSVKACYANFHTLTYKGNPGSYIGGFAGSNSFTVTGAYTLGSIELADKTVTGGLVAGFIAANAGGNIQNAYTACTYGDGINTAYGFGTGASGIYTASCYYRECATPVNAANGTAVSHSALGQLADSGHGLDNLGFTPPSSTLRRTYPYLNGGSYPFPFLNNMDHYGDWPFPTGATTLLAYCEKYDSNGVISYGYYLDGTHTASLPLRNDLPLVADGYALLRIKSDTMPIDIRYGKNGNHSAGSASAAQSDGVIKVNGTDFRVYRLGVNASDDVFTNTAPMQTVMTLGSEIGNACATASFYYRLDANGATANTFYFNPSFAKAAFACLPVDTAPTANPTTVCIRSARQLYNLGMPRTNNGGHNADYLYWNGLHYTQELDIDFTTYDYSFYSGGNVGSLQNQMRPIGLSGHAFSGSYDGGAHIITGTGIAATNTDDSVGLFGQSGATLRNILFIADQAGVSRTIGLATSTATYTGGLVGLNTGSITNCAVAGFTVQGGSVTGGFVGRNEGPSITNCAAANYTTGIISGDGILGGFVGSHTHNTLTSCYAIASLSGSPTTYGGFYGSSSGSGISNCYCATSRAGVWQSFGAGGLAYDGTNSADLAAYTAFGGQLCPPGVSEPYTSTGNYPWRGIVTRNGLTYHYGDWPT